MLKIENFTDHKSSAKIVEHVRALIKFVPKEHLRGIERLRLVDSIADARLKSVTPSKLPGLYHPRQGTQTAWLEIAVETLLPSHASFYKRLLPRLSLKDNIAAVLFSLIGQHYYFTLKHSVKKSQIEILVRSYTEKHLKLRNEREKKLRARLFKPLQPTLERWARQLQKRTVNAPK
ncbi:MAG: hypothetical protein H0V88_08065 [Pyrinomonadaceae bacterium]|nr:hypothetical protein [Pyrinomonadaceae bacterium]